MTEETKQKIHTTKSKQIHYAWKGDEVGYKGVHSWVRRHYKKPELCDNCHIKPSYDWANISGNYLRDRSDWQALCRKCHMVSDGRIRNLKPFQGE